MVCHLNLSLTFHKGDTATSYPPVVKCALERPHRDTVPCGQDRTSEAVGLPPAGPPTPLESRSLGVPLTPLLPDRIQNGGRCFRWTRKPSVRSCLAQGKCSPGVSCFLSLLKIIRNACQVNTGDNKYDNQIGGDSEGRVTHLVVGSFVGTFFSPSPPKVLQFCVSEITSC